MKKLTTSILFLLAIAMVPHAALAKSRSPYRTECTPQTSGTGFTLSSSLTTTGNVTLNILTGPNGTTATTGTTGATRFFPSGCNPAVAASCTSTTTGNAGDTFKIQDISSTNRARIEKIDIPAGGTATTGADSVVLKGIKIFALAGGAGKTFTLIYQTAGRRPNNNLKHDGQLFGNGQDQGSVQARYHIADDELLGLPLHAIVEKAIRA